MPENDDVEFLLDRPGEGPEGVAPEELPAGPRGGRRLRLGAALAAAAVLIGVGVALHGGPHRPGPPAPSPTLVAPRPAAPPTPPGAVAVSATGVWTLAQATLSSVQGGRVRRSVRVPELADVSPDAVAQLVPDPARPRLWVVLERVQPAVLIEYDARTLRRLGTARWRTVTDAAAALDGHLYLSTDQGVADLAPGAAQPRFVDGLSGAVGPVAADPARHRIIALDLGYPTDVWTYRPGSRPVEAAGTLPFGNGTLAVADGAIWVGGTANPSGVLERLDPATLRPAAVLPFLQFGGRRAVLVAGGDHAVWLHGAADNRIICLDARTGRVRESWDIAGVTGLASRSHLALVATATGTMRLALGACPG